VSDSINSELLRESLVNLKFVIRGMRCMNKFMMLSLVVVKGVGELFFVFGFLGWMYGVLVQLIHPEWLTIQLSHLAPWIRVDTFTIVCFIVSAIGFFVWRITREFISRDSRG
jgi:hypothetical protein